MYCNYCGKEVEENSRFCNFCGNCLVKELREQENMEQDTKESLKSRWQKAGEQVERENKEKELKKNLMELEEMQKEIEKDLKPKDGKYHVILVKSKYKYLTSISYNESDKQYILGLESVLEMMQNKGYEIVDIKIIGIQSGQGYTSRIETIIVYK